LQRLHVDDPLRGGVNEYQAFTSIKHYPGAVDVQRARRDCAQVMQQLIDGELASCHPRQAGQGGHCVRRKHRIPYSRIGRPKWHTEPSCYRSCPCGYLMSTVPVNSPSGGGDSPVPAGRLRREAAAAHRRRSAPSWDTAAAVASRRREGVLARFTPTPGRGSLWPATPSGGISVAVATTT